MLLLHSYATGADPLWALKSSAKKFKGTGNEEKQRGDRDGADEFFRNPHQPPAKKFPGNAKTLCSSYFHLVQSKTIYQTLITFHVSAIKQFCDENQSR